MFRRVLAAGRTRRAGLGPAVGAVGGLEVARLDADDVDGLAEVGFLRARAIARTTGWRAPGGLLLDPLDRAAYARHLVWRAPQGRVIASARLLLPSVDRDRVDMDYEASLPPDLPSRCLWGEVSRVALDRRVDNLAARRAIAGALLHVLVASGRQRLLAVVDRGGVDPWRELGAVPAGEGWPHRDVGMRPHLLLTLDVGAALWRDAVWDPDVWDACLASASSVARRKASAPHGPAGGTAARAGRRRGRLAPGTWG